LPAAHSQQETLRQVQDFYQREFDRDVAVRLIDAGGLPLDGSPPRGILVAEAPLDPPLDSWRVQLLGTSPSARDAVADEIGVYSWAAGFAVVASLGIAGVAGYALNRQIRLQEMRSSTLSTMSHELKTPLASIRVLLDTLLTREDVQQAQLREYLQIMSVENRRLITITENLLAAARFEHGLFEVHPVAMNAREAIDEALEAMERRFIESGARLTVDTPLDLPKVRLDKEAMVMALMNLMENALKYTDEPKEITIRAQPSNRGIAITVTDNGIGIPKSEQKKIFASFYQADQKLSRKHEGCGLGLSIVNSIVKAHGGKVSVTSAPGKGSTFSIQLPTAV
jgi:signal transduction histidine kinase